MKPNISVILPVYNGEIYLRQAIRSVLNQSFKNFELLILDDGSTDKSREIITSFKDKRIRYLDESENKGIVFQLNKGLKHAQADLIARMDADDICLPERFEEQKRYFDEDPELVLAGTAVDVITTGGAKNMGKRVPITREDIEFSICGMKNPFYHPSVMFRKNAVQDAGGYRTNYFHMEDFDLWMRLYFLGKYMINIPDKLLRYRVHPHQITTSMRKAQKETLKSFLSGHVIKEHIENPASINITKFLDIVRWRKKLADTKEEMHLLISVWSAILKKNIKTNKAIISLGNRLVAEYFKNGEYSFSTRELARYYLKEHSNIFNPFFASKVKKRISSKVKRKLLVK